MENEERDSLIKSLSEITPKYAYNCKDFIPGKTPVYYSGPFWDSKELEYGMKALLTGRWLTAGEHVDRFQRFFSKRFNVGYSHMVNSGSSANLIMIAALKKRYGWKDGDRVIVSPVGFPTTIAPLVQNGLKPVFVDIEMRTLNFDLCQIIDALDTPEHIVGVFVSPVLGNPPNMDRLKAYADEFGFILIGDNCDSLGTKWHEKLITDYYAAWSTSFYPAHHICTGEGGMVSSNDAALIEHARSFSWWGRDCHCVGAANLLPCGTCGHRFDKWLENYDGIVDHKYVFTNMGYNVKPLDIQGAFGLAQLEKFDYMEQKRRINKVEFQTLLEKYVEGIRIVDALPGADPSWFGVPIICESPELKNKLVQHLEDNKIQTRNYFAGNILMHPGYQHLGDYKKFPNANKALSNVFFVGCPPHYEEPVFNYIEEVLKKWVN